MGVGRVSHETQAEGQSRATTLNSNSDLLMINVMIVHATCEGEGEGESVPRRVGTGAPTVWRTSQGASTKDVMSLIRGFLYAATQLIMS